MEPPTNQEEFRRDTSFMYNTWLPQVSSYNITSHSLNAYNITAHSFNAYIYCDTSFMYNTWLPQALSSGVLVPSPRLQSASGGLRGLQAGHTLTVLVDRS